MKKYIVIMLFYLLGMYMSSFCQCTPPGVKVETPLCEGPSNFKTSFINCSTIRMAWKGNREQNYILRASFPDSAYSKFFEIMVNYDSCDKAGNCAVTMSIVPGTNVNWNVQGECFINNSILYSNKLPVQKCIAPFCKTEALLPDKAVIKEQTVQVYPNPSTGYLNVSYTINTTAPIRFSVVDMSGKMVFQKLNDNSSATGKIQLNLKHLSPGNYILQCTAGQYISETKFVMVKN